MPRVKKIRVLLFLFVFLLVTGAIGAYVVYQWIAKPNVRDGQDKVLFIPTGSDYSDVRTIIDTSHFLDNLAAFEQVAKWMKYGDQNVKSGKYILSGDWNNRQIIGTLRAGNQTPVNLIVNNVRTLADVAGQIGSQIELDSSEIMAHFIDSNTLKKYHYSTDNMLTMFIPNTYQLYWNTNVKDLLQRLKKEHDRFWLQDNRSEKAKNLDLTREEVYTLASIVEKETQAKVERPIVAGLYLNRLKERMPLQADPTVVFANGLFDLRRVLNKHLEIDSPYNTYKNPGLPPGPIYMPSIESLDAVLNAEKHTYLYMCARPDNSGLHAFASTISGHAVNANRYRRWLNQRGIR